MSVKMSKFKSYLTASIVLIYLAGVIVCYLSASGYISASFRLSVVAAIDVFGVSERLSERSLFPETAQLFWPFCVLLFPLMLLHFMLAFWAPPFPSYAKRLKGLEQVKFALIGTAMTLLGALLPFAFRGQDTRLFPIGSSLSTLLVLGWVPWAGAALALALGLSAVFRSVRP